MGASDTAKGLFETQAAHPVLKPPTHYELRDQLEQAVVDDLLGPAGGPSEEITEKPTDRYLVGMLAPRRRCTTAIEEEKSPATVEQFDELAVAGDPLPEEGPREPGAPQALPGVRPVDTLFPSSFGLSFCIPAGITALKVTARWGRYDRLPSETLKKSNGDPQLVWKRFQVEAATASFVIREGSLEPWVVAPDQPEVRVQGHARRNKDHWIVSLFLVNGQTEPERLRARAWIFQPQLIVESADGGPIFLRKTGLAQRAPLLYAEERAMNMLYRQTLEFAVGHGVAVHAEVPPGDFTRAVRISTVLTPRYDVPQQTPPKPEEVPGLASVVLDMKQLAETPNNQLKARLIPLVEAYAAWIKEQEEKIADLSEGLAEYEDAAKAAVERCNEALRRIQEGIDLLEQDVNAAEAFRFANRAMWLQRIHTLLTEARRREKPADFGTLDSPENRSWYPFQLAFILLNLPSVTNLHHPDRSDQTKAIADLLWYPTGGGKTEAYLGLTAYTLALRRLQGVVAGRIGEHGIAVLMRYTLRLLTIQQFQRATTLICACESIRRDALAKGDAHWGRTPFRIGLWVGYRTTPNTTEQSAESVKQAHGHFPGYGGLGSPAQLRYCPWCGLPIDPGTNIRVETHGQGRGRTFIYCGDPLGNCMFSARQSPDEGLPVLVVDEEIYRLAPGLMISTVDKFAQMPWKGETQMLFGQVNSICPRHGFRSPEVEDSDSHQKRGNLPAVKSIEHPPLRPPDLIIQDELHLISGPLGTLVGLYETVVDELCSWEVEGKRVRPKVVASTATVRRAQHQAVQLFLRSLQVFPPHGVSLENNFFSIQRPPGPECAGRRYIGVCAMGRRLKAALIRVYVAFLAAAQQLYDKNGTAADPWMTLVGYFNSLQELGGMRRLVDDDVRSRLQDMDQWGLAKRKTPKLVELTSRIASTDIPEILDVLEVEFDPVAEEKRKAQRKAGEKVETPAPVDVLLATNMLSVGVDVKRLGLMAVAGQPKATAEYIQATSRIGRSRPGLVCTVLNWARPRDLSHYERFEHYHATFYKHVEALSVTPFAPRARDRGLAALLVSLIRLAGEEFNANAQAVQVNRDHDFVKKAVDAIVARAEQVTASKEVGDEVRRELDRRLDYWLAEARRQTGGRTLGYRERRDGLTKGLLKPATLGAWDQFSCLNSLRDVEPSVGLILDDRGLDDEGPQTATRQADAQQTPGASTP